MKCYELDVTGTIGVGALRSLASNVFEPWLHLFPRCQTIRLVRQTSFYFHGFGAVRLPALTKGGCPEESILNMIVSWLDKSAPRLPGRLLGTGVCAAFCSWFVFLIVVVWQRRLVNGLCDNFGGGVKTLT